MNCDCVTETGDHPRGPRMIYGLPGSLFGVEIRVDRHLAGFQLAVQFGDGPIYVSPAMYDLISHADEKELRVLVENIHVRHLPPMPELKGLEDAAHRLVHGKASPPKAN